MTEQADLIIRNGTIVDGTGGEPFAGDVAIKDGLIHTVGKVDMAAHEEIDASGCIVTPGFVDIHTHYDGQAIWSQRIDPSSRHGVTTVVVGNCGVGFAPCRPEDHDALITVMEGVEDIPGIVMAEGLDWNWETFPEYIEAVDAKGHDVDIGAFLPHSPLRVYVMGDRAIRREDATPEDLTKMREIVREAMDAGAMGFATSRTLGHRTLAGDHIPTYETDEREFSAIVDGMRDAGKGIIQVVTNSQGTGWEVEFGIIERLCARSGRPATFTFAVQPAQDYVLGSLERVTSEGLKITGQIFPRPIGMVMAHTLSWNPFIFCESFDAIADLPFDARLKALRDPALRARLIAEEPTDYRMPLAMRTRDWALMFPFGDPPDYEPAPEDSIFARAERAGISPAEYAYDYLLGQDGTATLFVALGNYKDGSLDTLGEVMRHPNLVMGLGDGGAHYGLVCDSSYPTSLLTHWTRDRDHGRVTLPWAVQALSRRPAEVVGLLDRGLLAPGHKADVNVIDHAALRLNATTIAQDLPGGGRRLMQDAEGYRATIVSGEITYRDGKPTGKLPGRFVRGAREAVA